jgi:hypothetical protein
LVDYIERGVTPEDDKESKKIIKKATRFAVIESHLFRKGISTPLLKCIGPEEVGYGLAEIQEGSCGHHVRAKSQESVESGALLADYAGRCSQSRQKM